MKAVAFAEVARPAWEGLCDASAQAWLFHRAAWVDIEARRFVRANHSFALSLGGAIVGVQPLYLSDHGTGTGGEKLLHSGIHRHTGLALSPALADVEAKAARSAAMQRILAIAEREDVDRIQLNVHNLVPQNLGPERREIPFWVEDYAFEPGLAFASFGISPAPGMATCNSDQIVALDATEEVLFARLEESCRRAVRKAQASALAFGPAHGENAIEEHYRIAQLSARRTGEELPPIDYYRDVWHAFARERRCAALVAKHEGSAVASLLLLIDKGSASFLAGVSDPDFLSMRVNDFLHWSAICWAKREGLGHYRFGPWFPTVDAEWPIAKVSRFKKKFGAISYTMIQGSYFRHPEKYRAAGRALLDQLCAAEPRVTR